MLQGAAAPNQCVMALLARSPSPAQPGAAEAGREGGRCVVLTRNEREGKVEVLNGFVKVLAVNQHLHPKPRAGQLGAIVFDLSWLRLGPRAEGSLRLLV